MSHNIVSRSFCLSIVIPAKNEARRLPGSLRKIAEHFSRKPEPVELVVVDNGSTDGTGDVVRQFAESNTWLPTRVVEEPIPGKGAAVRAGMLSSQGDVLFQCDADLSMPIEELDLLQEVIRCGADIAIASREGVGANRVGESTSRWMMGRVFNLLTKTLNLTGLPDTQCGFKLFRRAIAQKLFTSQTIMGWGFDVEILVLAREHGFCIASIPINWMHDQDSRVCPIRDGLAMLMEVWAIRNRLKRGSYGPQMVTRRRETRDTILDLKPKSLEQKFGASLALRRSGLTASLK